MPPVLRSRRGRRSKFGAIRTTVDGSTFDSKRESQHFRELKLRELAGEIRGLKLQPTFDLTVNGQLICRYRADFEFEEAWMAMRPDLSFDTGWRRVVADSKGYRTRDYILKCKLMKAIHGIEIREL